MTVTRVHSVGQPAHAPPRQRLRRVAIHARDAPLRDYGDMPV